MPENAVSSSGSSQPPIATLPLRKRVRRLLPMMALAVTLVFVLLLALDKTGIVYALITFPHTPDVTVAGETFAGDFGFSVASAGDVNDDGFGDVVVGADLDNNIFVYKGSASGLTTTVYYSDAGQSGWNLGWSVDGGADVSGDNIDDFVAGAPISATGSAYVYHGSGGGLPTRAATLVGELIGDNFGWSVAIIGDVNNDGIADVAIGAPTYGPSDTGRVYIYHGPIVGNDTSDDMLNGEAALDGFGVSVAAAGDVNGDGIDDLAVGAWRAGGNERGRAYVFYGSNSGVDFASKNVVTGNINDKMGTSVHGADDVNGDGYDDVIVGSDAANPSTNAVGRAVVYPGGPAGLIATPLYSAQGEIDDDHFGFAVAGGGDLDGDGFSDFAAGAYDFDVTLPNTSTNEGKAYGYVACTQGAIAPSLIFSDTGEDVADSYGRSLAIVEDINGDSLDDMIVGAYGAKNPFPVGKIYAYYGVEGGCQPEVVLTKTVSLANFPSLFTHTTAITVPTNTVVKYTYAVQNVGNVTLTQHTVVDNKLGTVAQVAQPLPPGAIYTATITTTLNISTSNVATWTAAIPIISPSGQTTPTNRTLSAFANASAFVAISSATSDLDGDGVPDNEEGTVDEDGDGIPAYLDPDETPVTEGDVPIAGLSVTGQATRLLGQVATFNAAVTAGTNVSYTWNFGDVQALEIAQSSTSISHTYDTSGFYIVNVTAANSANQISMTKSIIINYPVRMPLIMTVGTGGQ